MKNELSTLRFIALLIVLAMACFASAKEAAEQADLATDDDIKSFDVVWKTIRDTHWDLDSELWDKARKDLREKAVAAKSRDEVREIISEMLDRLGQSHFGLIPAEAYDVLDDLEDDEEESDDKTGELGLRVRLVDNELLVTHVAPESAAATAGVKAGWTITNFKERTSEEILNAAREATETGPIRFDTYIALKMHHAVNGPVGAERMIEFEDHDGKKRKLDLVCGKGRGKVAKFGNLPKALVFHDTQDLGDGITYFAFNMFFDPPNVLGAYRTAVGKAQEGNGLILDLRGNLGGIGGMTFAMASAFVKERGQLGIMKTKDTELKFPLFPPPEPYEGPVAVLIDECSLSSAEIMAGGLQDLKLARLFGLRTGGLALPSMIEKLPNGDGFQYAFATYTSASGKTLEGTGVTPDETIKLSRDLLKTGNDPTLERAIDWIRTQKEK